MNLSRLEALWYEPGTAADAAAAANRSGGTRQHVTADHVRAIWTKAQAEGRLPPASLIKRPHDGQFPPEHQAMLTYIKHWKAA